MRVLPMFPPNIAELRKHFAIEEGVLFAYAPFVYNPYHASIDGALAIHESVHLARQGNDPDTWWKRYIKDEGFRLEEEFMAHLSEYHHRLAVAKNRHERRGLLKIMAKRLAAPLYGNLISNKDARVVLKRGYLYEPVREDASAVRSVRVE